MFALPIYIVSLGVSGGLVGIIARRLLAQQGFVPNFDAGTYATIVVGLVFVALQVAYIAFLRLLKPTRNPAVLLSESASNFSALMLAPFLLNVSIPWPHPALAKVAPLVFLGLFGGVHVFFKFFSLFTATQSRMTTRVWALGWLIACGAALLGAKTAFARWQTVLDSARVTVLPGVENVRVGSVFAASRRVPEGVAFNLSTGEHRGQNLVLRFAQPPDIPDAPKRIFVTLRVPGLEKPLLRQAIDLEEDTWAELRLAAPLHANEKECIVVWSAEQDPVWVAYTGMRPVAMSNQTVLMSGPWWKTPIETGKSPSFVVIVAEGIGADHVAHLGYTRATTPNIDRFAGDALSFRNCFTPAPEAAAACMALLTGMTPLRTGYLGGQLGPLPDGVATLAESLAANGYATAAFTEGDAPGDADLTFGSGFERGFTEFDHSFVAGKGRKGGAPIPPALIPASSSVTLGKAAEWIEAHAAEKFFVFVRLRELRAPQWLDRYGGGFIGGTTSPSPIDIYDTALQDVDKQLGLFFTRIGALPSHARVGIALTSTNGYEFVGAWRTHFDRRLTEATTHIPLILRLPGETKRQPMQLCGLEDVASTLLAAAGIEGNAHAQPGEAGDDALQPAPSLALLSAADGKRKPVSMHGSPLLLSLRAADWRLTWNSGVTPFTRERRGEPRPIELLDLTRYRAGLYPLADTIRRQSGITNNYAEQLIAFMERNKYTPPAKAATP